MTTPLATETVYAVGEACRRQLHADAGRVWQGYSVLGVSSSAELTAADEIELPAVAIVEFSADSDETAESIARLKRRWPALGVIVRIAGDSMTTAVEAIEAGATDAVAPSCEERQLARIVAAAIDRSRSLLAIERDARHRLASLTPPEREVLNMVVAGCEIKEIAARLSASLKTVELHRSRILHKTGARTVVELVNAVKQAETRTSSPLATLRGETCDLIDDIRIPTLV